MKTSGDKKSILKILSLILLVVDEVEVEMNEFQFASINPAKNFSSLGILSMDSSLPENEFLSYKDSGGSYMLISNFGDVEYKCTGTCTCVEEDKRRITGISTISRSLIYLVTAVSATLAIKAATNQFNEECVNELGSNCPEPMIQSKVDDCEALAEYKDSIIQQEEEDEHLWLHEDYDPRVRFECMGKCMWRQGWPPVGTHALKDWNQEFFYELGKIRAMGGCGRFKQEAVFKLTTNSIRAAEFHFVTEYLDPFCRDMSTRKWKYFHNNKEYEDAICLGGLTFFVNPDVHCRIYTF